MVGKNGIYLLSMKETKFKHTEIGLIPEDWEILSLGDIGDVRMCKRILKHQTSSVGDIPFYKIGTFGKEPDAFISRELFEEYRRLYNYPKQGDVLLSAAGTIGRTVLFDGKDAYFQDSNIVWIENNERKLLNGLLYYIYNKINWVADTGTIPRIYNDIVRKIFISFPPTKAEQSRIATALYDIDTLIRNLDRTIEKKKNIRQGAMEQLLSGKKRLPGFKGEWKPVRLNEIFFFGKGKGLKKEELTENGKYKCILYGEIFTQYNCTIKSVVSKTDKYEGTLSKRGDILMPGSTTTTGIDLIKAVSLNEDNVLLGGDVIILRPKDKRFLCSDFMAYLMSVINRKNIADVTQGTTIIHLHTSNMTDILYTIPPTIKEQYAISDMLIAMDDEIAVLQMERDKYANIRSGMMDDLLTGAKRL